MRFRKVPIHCAAVDCSAFYHSTNWRTARAFGVIREYCIIVQRNSTLVVHVLRVVDNPWSSITNTIIFVSQQLFDFCMLLRIDQVLNYVT